MSIWVRALVFGFVGVFGALAAALIIKGDIKAAAGAFIPAALASPLLLEAWRPGKYVLRKPSDGSPDNLFNRLKQFRVDHPGVDGTLLLGAYLALLLVLAGGLVVSLVRAVFMG
jgi:hypothetical protein